MDTSAAAVRPPVLRSRPLGALLAAEVLSTTGSQMTWLALPWFVLVTSGSKQMAFVIAAEAGGYALFGIPSGSLLELLGPQRTMRLCDAVRAPLMLLVPVLHWRDALTPCRRPLPLRRSTDARLDSCVRGLPIRASQAPSWPRGASVL
jgi:hypothetical protein